MIKSFFKLKRDPFTKDISSQNVFHSNVFNELSSRLDYMKKNRGLLLVTGEPGVGKTVAIRSFVENLNPNLYFSSYFPLATVSPIEFTDSLISN